MREATVAEKLTCTIAEAQTTLSIGRTQMYDLLRRGEIVSVKIGRRRVIPTSALNQYIDRLIAEQRGGQGAA